MAWLTNILGRGESREEIEKIVEPTAPSKPSRPPLLLLVSDASGMAALRLVEFENSQDACDYVEFWYPNRSAGTVYAIWALPAEPDSRWMPAPEHRGEAVILVRDDHRTDVVYPFSFGDLDAAWAFLRKEMAKDLDLTRVMIYWAVPIDIEVDGLGKIHMSPDAPPPSALTEMMFSEPVVEDVTPETVVEEAPPEPVAAFKLPEIVVEVAATTADEESEVPPVEQPVTRFVYHDEPAADESHRAAEEMFQDDADDLPANVGQPDDEPMANRKEIKLEDTTLEEEIDEEPVAVDAVEPAQNEGAEAPAAVEAIEAERDEEIAGDPTVAEALDPPQEENAAGEPTMAETAEPIEALPELVVEKFGTPFHETEFSDEHPLSDAGTGVNQQNGNGKTNENGHPKPAPAHLVDSEEIQIEELKVEASTKLRAEDGKEDRSSEDEVQPAPEQAQASKNGHKPEKKINHGPTDRYEVEDELARVLEGRRFTRQEGPFKGFNSPRGRF